MYRLVFVDDEPWALTGLRDILDWEAAGFDICACCESAGEALEAMEQYRPHAVFTDIRMPGMSGIEMISTAKSMGIQTEFVIISAYGDFTVAKEAIQYGALHYLLKPLNQEEVEEVARRLLERLCKFRQPVPVSLQEPLSHEQEKFLLDAAKHRNCYFVLSDWPEGGWAGPQAAAVPVLVGGESRGILLSTSRLPPPAKCRQPCSRRYPDFSQLPEMVDDALIAGRGGFAYSGHDVVDSIQRFLGERYCEEISLRELGAQFFLSEAYLCDLFKRHTGETILNFLKRVRIKRAKHLLSRTDMHLRTIAEQVGYPDYSYFGKLFKAATGYTPDLYRKHFHGEYGE